MGLPIYDSPDITLLAAKVTFDISGVTPVIYVENQSAGPDLAAVSYAFIVKSPTTTYIHDGNLDSPDVTGVWTEYTLSDPWPRPFGNIEWSGAPYTFQIIAKDGNGNIYQAPVQNATICHPNGNLPTSKNTYGVGDVLVQTKCEQARIYFQDITNTSYKGITGTVGSSVLRVNFPMDNTGVVPDPFQINYFSSAMVPITYSGKGYQYLYTSIYDYDMGNEVHIRIKYLSNDTFGVWCNIDLMPLICEYQKLIASIEAGTCRDVEEANRKLMLINPKFSLVVIGMFQPLTGIDVPAVIEEIKLIGGFDCDCCNAATGIVPPGSSAFDGYTFSVVPLGGDVEGEFVVNGYNIQLQLSDVSYVFKMCDQSPSQTTAFSVNSSISGDGYTKTYCLYVDMYQLSEDILNIIKTDAGLANLFNSIVVNNGGNFTLIVDGKCIFGNSSSYDYEFTIPNVPPNTTFYQLSGILINSASGEVLTPLNFLFNMSNLPALQTYLNSLGYGTFVVDGGSIIDVIITSTNNSTNINALYYNNGTTIAEATMVKSSSGYVPLSANQVVQNIINYLCALDDSQVVTSADYEICWVDGDGVKQTTTVEAGTDITSVFAALAEKGCLTVDYIVNLKAVNCANIKEQFPPSLAVMQSNDVFLGTKEGNCAGIYPVEAFLMMLSYGQYNEDVVTAFCNMVSLCGGGKICVPYNVFYAAIEAGSPGLADLVVTFQHPDAVSNTIRYARIDNTNTPAYITIPGVLPGESPYTIPGVEYGQYRVGITPVYADGRACAESLYNTAACQSPTSFNAIFDGTNIIVTGTVPDGASAKVNLSYPNGGSFSQIYSAGEGFLSETITPPVGVYGVFFATLQTVCDTDSDFMSAATAPASFEITETSP